jgi:hypothetical protein
MNITIESAAALDPFFTLTDDRDWNACIGIQGGELNYVGGYIAAACELAAHVIDHGRYEQRDTLVLPILYNARHGIELAQKFVIDTLNTAGVIQYSRPNDHDINTHWARLDSAQMGDDMLRHLVAKLAPFVNSLALIDDDGQSFRYHLQQNGAASLFDKSLANIGVIRSSLAELKSLIDDLISRTIEFVSERTTGTYTARCSRKDLFTIARLLPLRGNWNTPAFVESKSTICSRFTLTGHKFSDALDAIQQTRLVERSF